MTRSAPTIGLRIRALRHGRGLSLADIATGTGVSEATMSRIENGQSQVSAPHLYGLAQVLDVDISSFFTATATATDTARAMQPGTRAVTRAGQGAPFATPRLRALLLAGDLMHKSMHPFVNHVTATHLDQVGGLRSHPGEEFLYVLSGRLILHSATYAPLTLTPDDSVYFDARDPHAYLAEAQEGASFLVVSSTPQLQGNPDAR
jgi:transcriptional regulator with XRE-family HTH domain